MHPPGPARGSITVTSDADNPGRRLFHCHDLFHMATGMMTELAYDGIACPPPSPVCRDLKDTNMNRTAFRLSLLAAALAALVATAKAQAPDPRHSDIPSAAVPMAAPLAATPPMPPMSGAADQAGSAMGGDMGRMMETMRPIMAERGGMGMPFEHVEGRIAYLKAELKITDTQALLWSAVADVMRANAATMGTMQQQMGSGAMPTSLPARLQLQQRMMSAHLGAVNGLKAAVKPLYAALSPEQRTTIDETMASPMGSPMACRMGRM